MNRKIKFFFFGFGQVAKYFIKELINSKKKFQFNATNTKKSGFYYFKNKNIVNFNGKPLITHTIEAATESKTITQIVLSTDSKKIRQICEKAGLSVTHLRPKNLARDDTPTLDVIRYELDRLSEELSLKKD